MKRRTLLKSLLAAPLVPAIEQPKQPQATLRNVLDAWDDWDFAEVYKPLEAHMASRGLGLDTPLRAFIDVALSAGAGDGPITVYTREALPQGLVLIEYEQEFIFLIDGKFEIGALADRSGVHWYTEDPRGEYDRGFYAETPADAWSI